MFDHDADIRVNTVNCVGVMGAGIALEFKRRYPAMFADYQRACRRGEIQPGKLHIWEGPGGTRIINFPTKQHWRESSRYEYIAAGLQSLRRYLLQQGSVRVTLPALGCGHGGLDWNRVSKMIEDHLGDLSATILVFEPNTSRSGGLRAKREIGRRRVKEKEPADGRLHPGGGRNESSGRPDVAHGSGTADDRPEGSSVRDETSAREKVICTGRLTPDGWSELYHAVLAELHVSPDDGVTVRIEVSRVAEEATSPLDPEGPGFVQGKLALDGI